MGRQIEADARLRASEFKGALAPLTLTLWVLRLSTSLVVNAAGAWRELRGARRPAGREGTGTAFSWLDVKLGLRMLVKYPVLTLAGGLGIAVAIAIAGGFFTFWHAQFYPAIPLPEGDRLVSLENWDLSTNLRSRPSIQDYVTWRDEMQSVEDMAAFVDVRETLIYADGASEDITVAQMTPSGFALAEVPPLLGRSLVEADVAEGASPVVVIGYDVWRGRFAGDPDVLGRRVRLGDMSYEVVGVMPEGFAFPMQHRFWVPLRAGPEDEPVVEGPRVFVSGRLASGYDRGAAQSELSVLSARMAAQFPDTHGQLRARVMDYVYPLLDLNPPDGGSFLLEFVVYNGLILLLLVVVCLNVSALVYARAAMRRGEMAVRTALGASRLRIVGQMFVEVFVLCALSALAGVAIIKVGLTQAVALAGSTDAEQPFWMSYGLSGPGITYILGVTLLAAVLTGVLPGFQATGSNVQQSLRRFNSQGSPRLGKTWTALIVMQVAIAVAALPLGAALAWSQVGHATTSLKADVDQFVWFRTRSYSPGLWTELSRRIESEPDVIDFEFVYGFPEGGRAPGGGRPLLGLEDPARVGSVGEAIHARVTPVGQRFFEMMGASTLAGRTFRETDWEEGSWSVAVVNRAFADRYLDGPRAVGKRYRFANADGHFDGPDDVVWIEVVGVVDNIEENRIAPWLVEPRAYGPIARDLELPLNGLIRTAGDPAALVSRLEGEITRFDPTLVTRVALLGDIYREDRSALRLTALVLALSILAVLMLSAAGIYAMMSFVVSCRHREIAIRTALGAHPRRLLGAIFGRALRQVALGVVVGVAAALGIDTLAGGEVLQGFGVPLLAAMVLLMSAVGFIAVVGPARRGLGVAPTEALSGE
jgi:predicted permease